MTAKQNQSEIVWTSKELITSVMWMILILVQLVFPVLFFNFLGFSVFVYIGVLFLGAFFVITWISRIEFNQKGGIPQGKNCMYTTVLVQSGIYSVVRHPMYTAWILLVLSFPLFSQHWFSLCLGVLTTVLIYRYAIDEDKRLVKKFGNKYEEYMETVPRVNIITGIYARLRSRR
ncbi:MAG: isoprenylcysteine carboxylmethyltransferase family protein [Candidatus Bathyarchaeota archaeon]|nr:isoprenylcysteine carboxylmethyltransferase family protein [Candidatus Bathyarchaeota archaeon]